MKDEIFFCSCHGEGVVIRKDEDFTYLSIWGYADNTRLWWRLKEAWHALRGTSCTEVVLSPETTFELVERLQKPSSMWVIEGGSDGK